MECNLFHDLEPIYQKWVVHIVMNGALQERNDFLVLLMHMSVLACSVVSNARHRS